MTTQLTPAQHAILAYAHTHTEGRITWFPENINGGARQKVIDGLLKRALITCDGKDWFVAADGYEALGVPHMAPVSSQALDEVILAAEQTKPRIRSESKQAQVIALLRRPEGATIAQIMEVTGWQQHTVRGALAGNFKKKLALVITSEKPTGGVRTYQITN